MSTIATLARPYAKAAYTYAVKNDVVKDWLNFLNVSGEIVLAPNVAETFKNPKVEKENILTLFLGKEATAQNEKAETFRNFIQLLWENQRLPVLSEIAKQFSEFHLHALNIVEAELIVAKPISEEEVNHIKQQLEKKWGVTLEMQLSIDESLLGGALIRVGDQVIDGSIKTQIESLAKSLENFV